MPQSVRITETSPLLHDANCVYCHADLELGDHVTVCHECHSPHHVDCWEANRNECATFGCEGGGVPMPVGARIDADVFDDALGALSDSGTPNELESSWDGFVVGIIMLLALLAVAALMFPSILVYN